MKAELLSAVCYHNRKDLYTFLRNYKIPFSLVSLYKAVMNENIDTDFVELLTGELGDKDEFSIREKYLMQMTLGMALKHSSPRVANSLIKASGILPSTVVCYCAVRIGRDQEIHASVLFQSLLQHNQWQPNVYHVLKRIRSDTEDTRIICELISSTKSAQEPFQNSNLFIHGISFIREWANTVRSVEMETDEETNFLTVKDIQAWESAMSSFMDVKMYEHDEKELLNVGTALTTTLLLKDLTVAGFVNRFTIEQWGAITQRKNHDKSWSPEDAVICTLALIDEDLSIQPRKIWRGIEPRDSAKTRYVGVR